MGYVRSVEAETSMETRRRLHTRSCLRRSCREAISIDRRVLQEELVSATAFRYISDAITKEEALAMLKEKAATKAEREAKVRELGYVFLLPSPCRWTMLNCLH